MISSFNDCSVCKVKGINNHNATCKEKSSSARISEKQDTFSDIDFSVYDLHQWLPMINIFIVISNFSHDKLKWRVIL